MIFVDHNSEKCRESLISDLEKYNFTIIGDKSVCERFEKRVLNKFDLKPFVRILDTHNIKNELLTIPNDNIFILCEDDYISRKNLFEIIVSYTENLIFDSQQFFDEFCCYELEDDFYVKNKPKINEISNILSHEQISYNIFTKYIFSFVKKFGIGIYNFLSLKEKYLDDSIPFLKNYLLNVALYTENNNSIFREILHKNKTKRVIIFEPDFEKYLFMRDKYLFFNKIEFLEILNFRLLSDSITNDYSMMSDYKFKGGYNRSNSISLNFFILPFLPSYLIIDDPYCFDVLLGSKNLIQNKYYAPAIAINLNYHPSFIWTIPKLILSMNKNYTFYLRNYTGYVRDTILYAIPETR